MYMKYVTYTLPSSEVLIDRIGCTFVCFCVCVYVLSTQTHRVIKCAMYFPRASIRLAFNSNKPAATTTAHSWSGCVPKLMRQTSIELRHQHMSIAACVCGANEFVYVSDRVLICTQSINRVQSVSERIPFHRINIVHSSTNTTTPPPPPPPPSTRAICV